MPCLLLLLAVLAALLSPGVLAAVPDDVGSRFPNTSAGFAFNLFNNAWGTNYVITYRINYVYLVFLAYVVSLSCTTDNRLCSCR